MTERIQVESKSTVHWATIGSLWSSRLGGRRGIVVAGHWSIFVASPELFMDRQEYRESKGDEVFDLLKEIDNFPTGGAVDSVVSCEVRKFCPSKLVSQFTYAENTGPCGNAVPSKVQPSSGSRSTATLAEI